MLAVDLQRMKGRKHTLQMKKLQAIKIVENGLTEPHLWHYGLKSRPRNVLRPPTQLGFKSLVQQRTKQQVSFVAIM